MDNGFLMIGFLIIMSLLEIVFYYLEVVGFIERRVKDLFMVLVGM